MQIINHCWLCHQPLRLAQHGICCFCYQHLAPMRNCCQRCGLLRHDSASLCQTCQDDPPLWHSLTAVSDYQPPLKRLISQLKFMGQFQLAPALSRLLLLAWLQNRRQYLLPKPDLLLTVPLHKNRRWQRGFNQTEHLASPLAYWLDCDYAPNLLKRNKATLPQHGLAAIARKANLRHIFSCHGDVSYKHVALIDDVVTTGSTANEISRLLLAQGAKSVQIWCLCRTL